ncbi:MAG: hypothetical protein M0Z31_01455 [Clostridia bacterium]|nr:hypothetical protein [Clostridia bacterium]
MVIRTMEKGAAKKTQSANWMEKIAELIDSNNKSTCQREMQGLIELGQVTGVLRQDIKAKIMASIFLEIKKPYQGGQLLSKDVVEKIVEILFRGLTRKGDFHEGN